MAQSLIKKTAEMAFKCAEKFGSNGEAIFSAWLDQVTDHGFLVFLPREEDWQSLQEMINTLPSPGWPERTEGEAQ